MDSQNLWHTVTQDDVKEVKDYSKFRKQAQLAEDILKDAERRFTKEPETFEEYMEEVNKTLQPEEVSEDTLLRSKIYDTYHTSCVPLPFLVNMLQKQGINNPISWAVRNIESDVVSNCVDTAKMYWTRSNPIYEYVKGYMSTRKPIKNERDFNNRCEEYISFLPTAMKNEDSPKLYLAFLAVESLQGNTVVADDLDQNYQKFFSEFREVPEDKTVVEKAGALYGSVLKTRMEIQDQFESGQDGMLGEEYAQRYRDQREAQLERKRRLREERMLQDEEEQRLREREMERDRDYQYQGPLGYLDRELDRHQRYRDSDYRNRRYHEPRRFNPDSNYRDRDRHDISMKINPVTKAILGACLSVAIGWFLFGPFKGIMFGIFISIAIYGALKLRGEDVPNMDDDRFPPGVIILVGIGLAIFTVFLKL